MKPSITSLITGEEVPITAEDLEAVFASRIGQSNEFAKVSNATVLLSPNYSEIQDEISETLFGHEFYIDVDSLEIQGEYIDFY